jgi:RND family efflux transporter MFP subunit
MKTAIHLLAVVAFALIAACSKTFAPSKPPDVDYYTCTMHPSVRAEIPGKCPICGMELVPVMKRATESGKDDRQAAGGAKSQSGDKAMSGMGNMPGMSMGEENKPAGNQSEFVVPVERQQQIGVTYAAVERKPLHHTIRAVGMVEPDLQRHWAFVARVDGYVQQMFVTSPGEIVEKDSPLISIYSPDLVTTARELVMLLRMRDEAKTPEMRRTPERLIAAAKSRLEQWNITEEQIAKLERDRVPETVLTLRSPFHGVVQEVPAHQGVNVKVGDHLVDVVDLSLVWVWAEFYENELSMLKQGQTIEITSNSYPGEKFEAQIAVINPFLDPAKRTARVRIDIPNPDYKLGPGMYANAALAMDMGEGLTVPTGAVMPTGTRSVVFVDKGAGKLEPRVVQLGQQYDDRFEVKVGLVEGERVVASANFLIDAESKVQGALKSFEEPQQPQAQK